MLGAIVLSEYNEIVHVFGNAKFQKNLEKTFNEKLIDHVPSTSGISSSSSNNSLNLQNKNLETINNKKLSTVNNRKKVNFFFL